jgi:hypothetical protein
MHSPAPENSMNDYEPPYRDRGTSVARSLLLLGAVGLIAAPFVRTLRSRWNVQKATARTEEAVDKTLKDTYPASDPPASQYFDIPSNRQ